MDPRAGIALTDEHLALRDAVHGWARRHCPPAVVRAGLDADAEVIPPFWGDLVAQGWIGLAVGAGAGGQGFGLAEAVVVIEELGRGLLPGPLVPTCLAATALDRFGGDALRPIVADLATGQRVGTVGIGPRPLVATAQPGGGVVVDGAWEAVVSAALADVLVLPVVAEDAGDTAGEDRPPESWVVVDAADVHVEPAPSLDRTRRVATVRADRLAVPAGRVVTCATRGARHPRAGRRVAGGRVGRAGRLVRRHRGRLRQVVREQFGRPIGQFQAVKHRCADMLCALEQARAATWDAARAERPRPGRAGRPRWPAPLAPDAAFGAAKDCIQVLGGIGFTWEHDAHLYLKRAAAIRLLLGGPAPWRARGGRARAGGRPPGRAASTCPPRPRSRAPRCGPSSTTSRTHPQAEWNRRLADSGYLVPHWPAPWGRDAGPVEQLVIDEEFARARVRRPHLAVGGVGAADDHRPRHRRAAGAVGGAHAARRADVVPDVQRARRRLRPGLADHEGGAGRRRLAADRPEGVDVDGGQRRPRASAWPAPTRRRRGTRASPASSSTWGPRASTSARCAS